MIAIDRQEARAVAVAPVPRLLCVAVAGADVGYGHLARVMHLAAQAHAMAMSTHILVVGDTSIASRVRAAGFDCSALSLDELPRLSRVDASCCVEGADVVVLDVSTTPVLARVTQCAPFFHSLRARAEVLCVLDGLPGQQLSPRLVELPVDVAIVPYIGAQSPLDGARRVLTGHAYAVLSPEYHDLSARDVRQVGDRVLVTCGGSDPARLSLRSLHGLRRHSGVREVRVIIGPLFPAALIAELHAVAPRGEQRVTFITSPPSLLPHLRWCDVAVSCSGLTKYELACSGTPAALVSIDAAHASANLPFVRAGTALDLGVRPPSRTIARAVGNLLDDVAGRQAMAVAGPRLVDGRGAVRLLTEIARMSRVGQ